MPDDFEIAVKVDPSVLLGKIPKAGKRLAYSVATAINKTALRVQRSEQEHVDRAFTIRKHQFIRRQVAIIKPFANARQGRPFAEISVGQKPRLHLSVFERGGIRRPAKGRRVAVPVTGSPARPTFDAPVPEEFYFNKLRFTKTRLSGTFTKSGKERRTRGGKGIRYGQLRTYLIPEIGVFQRREDLGRAPKRTGENKEARSGPSRKHYGSQLLFVFVRQPRLKAQLGFVSTAKRIADRYFPAALEREVTEVLIRAGFRR